MTVAAVRTPDERFADLPDFPWEPKYLDWDGLRLARIDEGEGADRRPLPRRADLVVPVAQGDAAAARRRPPLHRPRPARLRPLRQADRPRLVLLRPPRRGDDDLVLDELGVRDATFVVHDWGGPIGMRVAAERPEMCARIVVMDTGIFTGHQRMTDAWIAFRDFVERTEDLPVSMLVKGACATDPGDDVVAAYDAPFPDPRVEGRRARLPADAADQPRRSRRRRGRRPRPRASPPASLPSLCLWADSDPIIPLATGRAVAERLNLTPSRR